MAEQTANNANEQQALNDAQNAGAGSSNNQQSGDDPQNKGGNQKPVENQKNPYEVELERDKELTQLRGERDNLNIALREARAKLKETKERLDAQANQGESNNDSSNTNFDEHKQALDEIRAEQKRLELLLRTKEVDDELAKYVNDQKDKEVIKRVLQTRVLPSGSISEDVSNALVIYNKNKYMEAEKKAAAEHAAAINAANASGAINAFGAAGSAPSGGANVDPMVVRIMQTMNPALAKKALERAQKR